MKICMGPAQATSTSAAAAHPKVGGGVVAQVRLQLCCLLVGDLDVLALGVDLEQVEQDAGEVAVLLETIGTPSGFCAAGMLVLRIAASTFARVGFLPALQTAPIARITTSVAA